MTVFTIPPVTRLQRICDRAMRPLMYILGGFTSDAVQETHPWHTWRGFEIDDVDITKAIRVRGTDPSRMTHKSLFLFHAPLFGGWKNYVIVMTSDTTETLHVGWIVRDTSNHSVIDYGINKRPIKGRAVRLLVGPPSHDNYFFLITRNGFQATARVDAYGTIGKDHDGSIELR